MRSVLTSRNTEQHMTLMNQSLLKRYNGSNILDFRRHSHRCSSSDIQLHYRVSLSHNGKVTSALEFQNKIYCVGSCKFDLMSIYGKIMFKALTIRDYYYISSKKHQTRALLACLKKLSQCNVSLVINNNNCN